MFKALASIDPPERGGPIDVTDKLDFNEGAT